MLPWQLDPLEPPMEDPARHRTRLAVCGSRGPAAAFARAAIAEPGALLLYVCESRGQLRAILDEALPILQGPPLPGFRPGVLQALMSRALGDRSLGGLIIVQGPDVRSELVAAALRAGKHVLVEPPLALSVARARELLDQARGRELNLFIASSRRDSARLQLVAEAGRQLSRAGHEWDALVVRRTGDAAMPAAARTDWRVETLIEDLFLADELLGPLTVVERAANGPSDVVLAGVGGRSARLVIEQLGPPRGCTQELLGAGQVLWRHVEEGRTVQAEILEAVTEPLRPTLVADWNRFQAVLPRGGLPGPVRPEDPERVARELDFIATLERVLAELQGGGS